MTPTIKKAADTFARAATRRNIDLTLVDIKWLEQMIAATQICDFKTEKIFLHFVEKAVDKAQEMIHNQIQK